MKWREYEQQAAGFFTSLGLNSQIQCKVQGARAEHEIDVFVTGAVGGIEFKWVVECKDWKVNIPKEKVIVLAGIVQDVGADRGFLLSEKGFQSGALLAARATNLTLTSVADLSHNAQLHSVDTLIGRRHWELQKARFALFETARVATASATTFLERSQAFFKEFNNDPMRLAWSTELAQLDTLLSRAGDLTYPFKYPTLARNIASPEDLVVFAGEILAAANAWIEQKKLSIAIKEG